MKYEVRKGGKAYMSTTDKRCVYTPEVEAGIQAAGYAIYVDGKRKPKVKLEDRKEP